MKKTKPVKKLIFLFTILGIGIVFSQKKQEIKSPAEGKSLVYIIRTKEAFLLNFRLYDKDKYLGAIGCNQYIVYECNPGEHLFWAVSENRSFVKADLKADKAYVLIIEEKMGVFIARVKLVPLDPRSNNSKKYKRKFYRAIKNDIPIVYIKENVDVDKSVNIKQGLKRYEEIKDTKSVKQLSQDMYIENADKP